MDSNLVHEQSRSTSRGISLAIGVAVALLGMAVLVGWSTDLESLRSMLPGLSPMRPPTAVGLILAAVSLLLLNAAEPSAVTRRVARFAAGLVLLLGLAGIFETAIGLNLGVGGLVVQVPADSTGASVLETMPLAAATGLVALGSAILLLDRASYVAAQVLALLAMTASVIVIGGYLFGATTFPAPGLAPPTAAHAALGVMLLSIGIMTSSVTRGLFRHLQGRLPEIGLGSVLILLLVAGVAALFDTERMAARAADVEQTYRVLERLRSISLGAERTVTIARIFVLTGEEGFVKPLTKIRAGIEDDLSWLAENTAAHPDQQARLALLEHLLDRRLEMTARYIEVRRRADLEETVRTIPGGGEQLAADIRAVIDEMEQAERTRLAQHQISADASHVSALAATGFSWIAGLVVFLLVCVEVRKRVRERAAMEREIVAIREHERTRIGRDLHDGLGQELTGLALGLEMLAKVLGADRSPHEGLVRNLRDLTQKTIAQTRQIARSLSPGFWSDVSLRDALVALAEEIRQNADVECTVEGPDIAGKVDPEVTINIYRIVQEAITNALRHGGARKIVIRFSREAKLACLEVIDDGCGIPPSNERNEGIGLRSMRYRARVIGGALDVEALPEGGTRVRCRFDWPRKQRRSPRKDDVLAT